MRFILRLIFFFAVLISVRAGFDARVGPVGGWLQSFGGWGRESFKAKRLGTMIGTMREPEIYGGGQIEERRYALTSREAWGKARE